MAKYTRHDARNKKKGRHKFLTLNKEAKLHSLNSKRDKYKIDYDSELHTRTG